MARAGPLRCPQCDSTRVRRDRSAGLRKRLFALLGYDFARCAACAHRFLARPGGHPAWARCPRCLAQDLSIWDPGRYRASRWNAIKLWMGGHPWRCERCRTNFVSFRARKTEYVRPRAD